MIRNIFRGLLALAALSLSEHSVLASSSDTVRVSEIVSATPATNLDGFTRGVQDVSARLGISPVDLATFISYETGGTFDPWFSGVEADPYGKPRRGYIQMGTDERLQYGYDQGNSDYDNVQAVGRFLKDRGVKPGSTELDIYSAIYAGRVGRPNATDAANGGMPETVRDKVYGPAMEEHRQKASELLVGTYDPALLAKPDPQQTAVETPSPGQPDGADWAVRVGYHPEQSILYERGKPKPTWKQIGSSLLRDAWQPTRELGYYFTSDLHAPDYDWLHNKELVKFGTTLDGIAEEQALWIIRNSVSFRHAEELRAKINADNEQAQIKDVSSLAFWGGQLLRVCDPLLLSMLVFGILAWRAQRKGEDHPTSKEA